MTRAQKATIPSAPSSHAHQCAPEPQYHITVAHLRRSRDGPATLSAGCARIPLRGRAIGQIGQPTNGPTPRG